MRAVHFRRRCTVSRFRKFTAALNFLDCAHVRKEQEAVWKIKSKCASPCSDICVGTREKVKHWSIEVKTRKHYAVFCLLRLKKNDLAFMSCHWLIPNQDTVSVFASDHEAKVNQNKVWLDAMLRRKHQCEKQRPRGKNLKWAMVLTKIVWKWLLISTHKRGSSLLAVV